MPYLLYLSWSYICTLHKEGQHNLNFTVWGRRSLKHVINVTSKIVACNSLNGGDNSFLWKLVEQMKMDLIFALQNSMKSFIRNVLNLDLWKLKKNKMCPFCQANLNWGLQQRFCLGGLLTKTLQKNSLKILLNSKSRKYDKMRVFCDLF